MSSKSRFQNFFSGSLVQLKEEPLFGVVIGSEKKYDHDGCWVFWTNTGRIAWSPSECLDILNESVETLPVSENH